MGGEAESLQVEGREHLKIYRAKIRDDETGEVKESSAERNFCGECGSALWLWDPRWPHLLHPFASAIDTELPKPPERTHLMEDFKASWIDTPIGPNDQQFGRYPAESIASWHERLGLTQ